MLRERAVSAAERNRNDLHRYRRYVLFEPADALALQRSRRAELGRRRYVRCGRLRPRTRGAALRVDPSFSKWPRGDSAPLRARVRELEREVEDSRRRSSLGSGELDDARRRNSLKGEPSDLSLGSI